MVDEAKLLDALLVLARAGRLDVLDRLAELGRAMCAAVLGDELAEERAHQLAADLATEGLLWQGWGPDWALALKL